MFCLDFAYILHIKPRSVLFLNYGISRPWLSSINNALGAQACSAVVPDPLEKSEQASVSTEDPRLFLCLRDLKIRLFNTYLFPHLPGIPVGLVKYVEVIDGFSVTIVYTLAKRRLEEKRFIWLTLPDHSLSLRAAQTGAHSGSKAEMWRNAPFCSWAPVPLPVFCSPGPPALMGQSAEGSSSVEVPSFQFSNNKTNRSPSPPHQLDTQTCHC